MSAPEDHTHVVPVGDLIEHDTEHQEKCPCRPAVEMHKKPDGTVAWLFIHNAADRRELREQGEKKKPVER